MKKKSLFVTIAIICVCFIVTFTQGCTNDEIFSKEEAQKNKIAEMLIDAGFTKKIAFDKNVESYTELKTAKDVFVYLEGLKKPQGVSGEITLSQSQIKKIKDDRLLLDIEGISETKDYPRTRFIDKECFDYSFNVDGHYVSLSFTLDIEFKYNEWRIMKVNNAEAKWSKWSDYHNVWIDGTPQVSSNNYLKFNIVVKSYDYIKWGEDFYGRDWRMNYDFELEIWILVYPQEGILGKIKYEGREVASAKSYDPSDPHF